MATVETNIDDTNDIPIRDNIVEHSNCDDYEELNRSWNTSDELDSSQDNILSKTDDFVTLPTATDSHSNGNSNSRSNSTLPSSILPDDIKIRLAVQSSLAVAATQPGAYHHDGDDGRGVGDGGTSAAGTLRNSESLLRPKPSQFELSRTIRRAYEAQLDARRHDDHGTRPSPPPDLDPLDAFPAPVVVCGHERMVDFQQGVAVEEEENRRQQRKRKRQTIGTIVASVVFMVVIAGAVFGITFGITRSSHQNATTSNGPGSDRDSGISSASFRANECYNDTLLGKGNATWERHSNFRLQMISQYPNITSLIDVPYSKENIALCWLSFFDQFHHVSEDKDELDLELAQRFALAILYFQFQSTPLNDLLGDDNAFVLGKWLSNLPACDWSYVECSDSIPKIITGLNIGAMDLAGRIPSELAMISTLKSLRCDENAFTGEIPSEMWTLTHLELLFLGNNYFNGTISNQLGNLQQLTVLSLANQLSGSVPDLRSLSKLTYLALSSPFLIGPFPKIEGLTSLGMNRSLSFRFQYCISVSCAQCLCLFCTPRVFVAGHATASWHNSVVFLEHDKST